MNNRKWHILFWGLYFMLNHFIFSPDLLDPFNLFVQFLFVLHNAGAAYIILDWWIPQLYVNKLYGRFLVATLLTIGLFTLLLLLSLLALFSLSPNHLVPLSIFFEEFLGSTFWSNVSGVAALLVPYFVLQRIEMERRNRQLEKEKLEAELKFLKSQLHPHFLFNALNNIYFLIKKDPDMAAEALAGFSNLLRFQLYEANNELVPLEKEMEYIQQFAEIAQLRKGANFEVLWTLPKNTRGLQIAPLLLMPLVENAFKHGANKNGIVDIKVSIEEKQLHVSISNTIAMDKSQGLPNLEEGGIGLSNIQKRLNLIYPDQHQLTIQESEKIFVVDLVIELTA